MGEGENPSNGNARLMHRTTVTSADLQIENMGTADKLLDAVARMTVGQLIVLKVQNAADLSAFATLPGAACTRSSLLVGAHIR